MPAITRSSSQTTNAPPTPSGAACALTQPESGLEIGLPFVAQPGGIRPIAFTCWAKTRPSENATIAPPAPSVTAELANWALVAVHSGLPPGAQAACANGASRSRGATRSERTMAGKGRMAEVLRREV